MPKLDIVNAKNVIECGPQKALFQIKNLGGPKGDKGERGAPGAGLMITGTNGRDGFSPIATVTQVGAGASISITDSEGTTTANVSGFVVDDAMSGSSTNPVQNKVIKSVLDGLNARILSAEDIYPVGSVITFYDNSDHSTHLGLTWELFATGKMIVGYDPNDSDFSTIGATGGEKAHTLTVDEMPSHTHIQNAHGHRARYAANMGSGSYHGPNSSGDSFKDANTWIENTTATNQYTGGSQAHNNMPPYIAAALWRRTA